MRMADATGQGDFRELLVRGVYGYVATYAAGRTAVLTLLAEDRVNVGRLHLEGRRAGARIGELVDAAARTAQAPHRPSRPPQTLRPQPHAAPRTHAHPHREPPRAARTPPTHQTRVPPPRVEPEEERHSWPTPRPR